MFDLKVNANESLKRLDHERGHSLIPDSELLAQVPKLYSTDGQPFEQKTIFLKYFCGSATWLIAELDQEEWLAFGYCDLGLGFPEWGYVSLHELAGLEVEQPMEVSTLNYFGEEKHMRVMRTVYAERELYWSPRTFGEWKRDHG